MKKLYCVPIVETATVEAFVWAETMDEAIEKGKTLANKEAYTPYMTAVSQLDGAEAQTDGICVAINGLTSPEFAPERENADENDWNLANLPD